MPTVEDDCGRDRIAEVTDHARVTMGSNEGGPLR